MSTVSFFFLMIRRPPRSTLLSLHDALPISERHPIEAGEAVVEGVDEGRPRLHFLALLAGAGKLAHELAGEAVELVPPVLPGELDGRAPRGRREGGRAAEDRLVERELRALGLP